MKYIISLKHTHKDDLVFTFWREHANGYCYRRDWAGKYEDAEINSNSNYYNDRNDTLAVDCDIIDKMWVKYFDDIKIQSVIEVVPITLESMKIIGITKQMLIAKAAYDYEHLVEQFESMITASSREYLLGCIDTITNPLCLGRVLKEQNVLKPDYMEITCTCGNRVVFKSADEIPKTNLKCASCQKVYLVRYLNQ